MAVGGGRSCETAFVQCLRRSLNSISSKVDTGKPCNCADVTLQWFQDKHHNHPSTHVGPPFYMYLPPHSLAVKMQGRGSIHQKFDSPSTPFIWRERTYERNKRVKQVRRSMFGKVVRPSRYRPLTRRSWIFGKTIDWEAKAGIDRRQDYYWWEGLTA